MVLGTNAEQNAQPAQQSDSESDSDDEDYKYVPAPRDEDLNYDEEIEPEEPQELVNDWKLDRFDVSTFKFPGDEPPPLAKKPVDHYQSDDEEPPPLQPRNEDYGSSSEGEESDDEVDDVPNLNPRRSARASKRPTSYKETGRNVEFTGTNLTQLEESHYIPHSETLEYDPVTEGPVLAYLLIQL